MADERIAERDELTQKVISDSPRLQAHDRFRFACHPGIDCFNACCADVNIVLTPLDILRLSRRLGLATTEFLARHTLVPFNESSRLPFIFLKMRDDERKTCPLVTDQGCGVYPDRPWPCRMYPIGEASPADRRLQGEGFFFLIEESHCRGHRQDREWTISAWLSDQGVDQYEEMGTPYRELLLHPGLGGLALDPARMEMFYMAAYDLDKFREFVFKSKFLQRFALGDELVEKLRSDDIELLKFAFRWLRFALFGELTLPLNQELLNEREREMLAKKRKTIGEESA